MNGMEKSGPKKTGMLGIKAKKEVGKVGNKGMTGQKVKEDGKIVNTHMVIKEVCQFVDSLTLLKDASIETVNFNKSTKVR